MVSDLTADPCGCLYTPDGSRLRSCGRGQQRAYPYTGEPTMHVLKANGWGCRCPGLRPRHRHQQPMDCIPAEALAAWRRAGGGLRSPLSQDDAQLIARRVGAGVLGLGSAGATQVCTPQESAVQASESVSV